MVVEPEPVATPSLRLTVILEPSEVCGSETMGFGVVDSADSVLVDSGVSDLVGSEALDAPSLTPALNPALRLTPAPVDLVGIGTGTIGLGVFEAIVESVSEASDRLDLVAVACDVSESRGSGVCLDVAPVSAVIDSAELDSEDVEALAKIACEDCTDSIVVGLLAVLD